MLELQVDGEMKTYDKNELLSYIKDACRKNGVDKFNVRHMDSSSNEDEYPEFRLEAGYCKDEDEYEDDRSVDIALIIDTKKLGFYNPEEDVGSEEPETVGFEIFSPIQEDSVTVSLEDGPRAVKFFIETGLNLLEEIVPDNHLLN